MPAYKDKNNTWLARFYYTDYTGKRKQKKKRGFQLKREAEEYERTFLLQANNSPDMLFSDFVELYKTDVYPKLKATTRRSTYYALKNYFIPYFGNMPLNEIKPNTILKWHNYIINQDFKSTYLATLHKKLSAIFNHAVRFYNLTENPCRKAGSIGSTKTDEPMQFWELEEFNEVIEHVTDIKYKTILITLFYTGIRKGELFALTWANIDFDNRIMSIEKTHSRVHGKDVYTSPKTKKSKRKILLSNQVITQLEEYKTTLYKPTKSEQVFKWSKRGLEQTIAEACKLSGVKRIRVHDLRHSHASLLIHLGFSPLMIADRLGHESVQTTLNTYSHLYPSEQSKLIDTLNNL